MYRTKQAAERAGIATSTVRLYSKEWGAYLSPGATVEGQTRIFTDADISVFRTVKALRAMGADSEEIEATLAAGERYEPTETRQEAANAADDTAIPRDRAVASVELLERFVKPWQERVERLETQLDAERAARLAAEVEAATLRGKLEAEAERKPWYLRLFGR